MAPPPFVDVHSHVVPTGDDGATTVAEGIELCALARAAGTGILFATPHIHAPWDSYPWTEERARRFAEAFPAVHAGARALGLDLRRGAELFPSEVHERDPRDHVLEGTEAVLVEFPGSWLDFEGQLDLVAEAGSRVEALGLVPVLAHPERCREVQLEPLSLTAYAERGWLLCLNGPSLVGTHGEAALGTSWELLDAGLVQLVASDGHRAGRPPTLDDAWEAVVEHVGEERAVPLFDGSALPWR